MSKKFFYKWTAELSEHSLLHFYDNPSNFVLKDIKRKGWDKNFPNNCLVLLTHGTFLIHSSLRDTILFWNWEIGEEGFCSDIDHKILRILKGFSDFWTSVLVKYGWIPKGKIIRHIGSRLIWDPNRDIQDDSFIRKADFYGNVISKNPEQYREEGEKEHKRYHNAITEWLCEIEWIEWWSIAFDIHDTWVRKLAYETKNDRFKESGFHLMNLWTRDGASCNPEILEYFSKRIEYYLWIKPLLNEPYKGGYVTQRHGEQYRKNLEQKWEKSWKRNVIQVEIGKFLYMQESTQKVDKERMEIIWAWMYKAIADTWKKFDKKYFENL